MNGRSFALAVADCSVLPRLSCFCWHGIDFVPALFGLLVLPHLGAACLRWFVLPCCLFDRCTRHIRGHHGNFGQSDFLGRSTQNNWDAGTDSLCAHLVNSHLFAILEKG